MPNAQEALSQDKTIRFIKRRWPSVIMPLIIGCAMSFGAYYMDHSRIFAFVIVPLATIQRASWNWEYREKRCHAWLIQYGAYSRCTRWG